MCLTNNPDNRLRIEKPEGYNEADYELLFRTIEQGQHARFFKFNRVTPDKISDYVVTERVVRLQEQVSDPVGMGSYAMDSHHTQYYVNDKGHVSTEGGFNERLKAPYPMQPTGPSEWSPSS